MKTERDRTLYLVDGTYLLYRAWHAVPQSLAVMGEAYRRNRPALETLLRDGAGTACEPPGICDEAFAWLRDPAHDRLPTNAVRGLSSVLIKLIREQRPTYMGVAFDLPGRVHRDDHYSGFVAKHPDYAEKLAGYKAGRPETPVEVRIQYPFARVVCGRALGIPILEAEGFEADDLIGTLARRARNRGFTVRIVTADKDLFQLVDDGIYILNPHKTEPGKSTGYHLMDAKVVEREFGVPPSQVVDVLALMGDTSDNIPGVPGIGEKGAKELIRRFGSVEATIEGAKEEGQITRAAYRKGLLEHGALGLFSKELATISEDAPVEVNLDDVWTETPDKDLLKKVFHLLAFEALLRDVEALPGPSARGAEGRSRAVEERAGAGGIQRGRAADLFDQPVVTDSVADAASSREGAANARAGTHDAHGGAAGADLGAGVTRESAARLHTANSAVNVRAAVARGAASATHVGAPADDADGDLREPSTQVADAEIPVDFDGVGVEPGGAPRHDADTAAIASLEMEEGEGRYRLVLDTGELASLLPSMMAAPRVAIGVETTSRDPMRAEPVGVSIAWEPHSAIYVPMGHRYLGAPEQPPGEEVFRTLAPLLESRESSKAGQNVKFVLEVLSRAGLKPAGFDFDTMIAAFMLESDRMSYALDTLAREYLADFRTPYVTRAGRGFKQPAWDQMHVETAAACSGRDADLTLRLAEVLDRRLTEEQLRHVFETIDMPLVEVLVAMETTGVRIDVELLRNLSREMGAQIDAIRQDIHGLAGHEFNVDSPRQLAKVLFEDLGLQPVSRTLKSGVSSTRDEDLEVLAARHPLPARVRDYRVLAKLRSTYVDALPAMVNPATGRVHTSFNPTGAATGRLSSSDPNLQNIPVRTAEGRKIRAAFVPEPGWTLVSADYSQVELRVMAHQSGDQELTATFARGDDIHRLTAAKIFNVTYDAVTGDQRRAAKTINFGILYGMGSQRLARDLAIPLGAAKELIESYFGRFPRIRAYIDDTVARAERDGFVSTVFGRVRRFPLLASTSRYQRQMAIRAAVNSTIQGTAADLMKIAMVRLHRAIQEKGLRARLMIQVHDELVLETPPDELETLRSSIREAMEVIPPFEVPLTLEISSGPNWLAAKP